MITLTSTRMRCYLAGYKGVLVSRSVRRIFAGSDYHRAWLQGYMALFLEEGLSNSVCDREWYQYRKGFTLEASLWTLLRVLVKPFDS